jgi:VacB/RNase II family 3'-5' exoribonuclease
VDPATARDFDDAVSLETDAQGNRVLGVHIADVSHFVRPNSPLDIEARQRGTSVYLVDKVVPMLPEQLSNGVCSLRPNEDRLTFSAFMTFDSAGRMIARRFAKTRIRSKLRLNYEQAMAICRTSRRRASRSCRPKPVRCSRGPSHWRARCARGGFRWRRWIWRSPRSRSCSMRSRA